MAAHDNPISRVLAKLARHEELTPEEAKLIDDWRRLSPQNERLIEQMQDAKWLRAQLDKLKPAPGERIWAEVNRRLDEAGKTGSLKQPGQVCTIRAIERARLKRSYLKMTAIAAIFCGLVVGAVLFFQKREVRSKQGEVADRKRTPDSAWKTMNPEANEVSFGPDGGRSINIASVKAGQIVWRTSTSQTQIVNRNSLAVQAVSDISIPTEGDEIKGGIEGRSEAIMQNLAVGKSRQPYRVLMRDGTVVWLFPGARLRYPLNPRAKNALVSLMGQARFEVAPDASNPFLIQIPSGSIVQVLGTVVKISADKTESHITLVSGRLQLQQGVKSIPMREHEELIERPGKVEIISLKDSSLEDKELLGQRFFDFRHIGFEEALKRVADLYGYTISNPDRMTGQVFSEGRIPRTESADEVLASLQTIQDGKVYIKRFDTVIRVSDKPF